MPEDKPSSPLVVLLLDTGDGEAIEKWTREGYLPTIASIMKGGCWGRTGGAEMICEYGVGLTLFSGISRAEHGYFYMRQLKPRTYELESVEPSNVNAPPFWSYLRGREKKVFVVDVPDVRIERGLPGIQLADWATHHGSMFSPKAEPETLLPEVERIFGERMVLPVDTHSSFEEGCKMRRALLRRVEQKGALCRELLSRDEYDLTVIAFSESDPAGHCFWDHRPEAIGTDGGTVPNELTHGIRDVYQAIDREMGKLLAALPSDANVVLVSMYGTQDEYPTTTVIEDFCKQLGYHVAASAGKGGGFSPLGMARRILPPWLRTKISHYLPRGTQERLLTSGLQHGTDWSKTTAFAIPSLFTSFVRVNLRGREPEGIVEPGSEYDAVLDRLEADLKQLVDPKTETPAMKAVSRTTELFNCGPHASLPDLFVEWQPGPRFLDRVEHPRTTLIQQKPTHFPSSQEKLSGFFAASGPAVRQGGDLGEVDVLDLVPTFLTLLGEPIPSRLGGKVIPGLMIGAAV